MPSTIPALLLPKSLSATKYTAVKRADINGNAISDDVSVIMLGGYRLVRKLGSGKSAEVWLGSDGSASSHKPGVAIKVYRPEVKPTRIDSEIEALGRISHRHLVRLDDLAAGPDGKPCLILQQLSTMSLGRLLGAGQPSSAEAVTILAPLALAVAELHRNGIAHGALRAPAVLFDDAGAPVLASFGSSVLFGELPDSVTCSSLPPALLAKQPSVVGDLHCLAELCRSTLGEDGSAIVRWSEFEAERAPHTFPLELADRLFSLSAAAPVSFSLGIPGGAPEAIQSRIETQSDFGPNLALTNSRSLTNTTESSQSRGALAAALSMLHIPDSLVNPVLSRFRGGISGSGTSSLRSRFIATLRPVRKPFWIVAGVVAAAVVAFAAFVPSRVTTAVTATRHASSLPVPGVSPFVVDPTISGDDPVEATKALLQARDRCFEALSVLCLGNVDQLGSSGMEADSNEIRLRQTGGVPNKTQDSMTGGVSADSVSIRLTVVESLGDTVLLSLAGDNKVPLTRHLSILIIREDNGWRIRDLVVADPPAN